MSKTVTPLTATTKVTTAASRSPGSLAFILALSDEARATGIRVRWAIHYMASPWTRHSAANPEAAWPGVAPALCSPASTTEEVPQKPTREIVSPVANTLPLSMSNEPTAASHTMTRLALCLPEC